MTIKKNAASFQNADNPVGVSLYQPSGNIKIEGLLLLWLAD